MGNGKGPVQAFRRAGTAVPEPPITSSIGERVMGVVSEHSRRLVEIAEGHFRRTCPETDCADVHEAMSAKDQDFVLLRNGNRLKARLSNVMSLVLHTASKSRELADGGMATGDAVRGLCMGRSGADQAAAEDRQTRPSRENHDQRASPGGPTKPIKFTEVRRSAILNFPDSCIAAGRRAQRNCNDLPSYEMHQYHPTISSSETDAHEARRQVLQLYR